MNNVIYIVCPMVVAFMAVYMLIAAIQKMRRKKELKSAAASLALFGICMLLWSLISALEGLYHGEERLWRELRPLAGGMGVGALISMLISGQFRLLFPKHIDKNSA